MFFSVFGGAWLLLGAYAFGHLSKVVTLSVVAGIFVLILVASRIQKRCRAAAEGAFPEEERRRNDRSFGIINAVTWISVALVFQIAPRIGYPDLAIPAVVLIVGLHFLPMPALYQHRANLVVGTCMMVWAIVCPIVFHGDAMIGWVACGAGLLLWAGSLTALNTAAHLMRESAL
jgi:hypothetical protein